MTYFDNVNFLNLDYIFNLVYRVVSGLPQLLVNALMFWVGLFGTTDNLLMRIIFGFVIIFSSGVIFYSIFKIWELHRFEEAEYAAIFVVEGGETEEKKMINQEWADILGHIESPNRSNWALAIIESDKIMDTLLHERGFAGKDIGEMLKSDKAKNLRTLQDAWECHKIRNKIAHESGYILEKREAQVAIAHFESVFKELGFLD